MIYKSIVSISNSSDKEITFHLEPWGEQRTMPPGGRFQVVLEANEPGEVEVEYEQDNILVWGWSGSVATVYPDGQAPSDTRPGVPPVPHGKSVCSFIRLITGKR